MVVLRGEGLILPDFELLVFSIGERDVGSALGVNEGGSEL